MTCQHCNQIEVQPDEWGNAICNPCESVLIQGFEEIDAMISQPVHGTKQWSRVKSQLKRRAEALTPLNGYEHDFLSMLKRQAEFVMSSPQLFMEAQTMLSKMEARD